MFIATGVGIGSFGSLASGQNLRVVAYNIEADISGVTTPRSGLYTALEAIGQQSFGGITRPIDILALEETTSNTATVAPIVTALNSYFGAGTYALANYQGTQQGTASDGNGPNSLIYNTTTVSLVLQNGAQGVGVSGTPSSSGGALRQVIRYEFQAVGSPAAASFYVYVSHMKSSSSGSTSTDQSDRNTEAQLITADILSLPTGTSALVVGDFNLDGSAEPAYQTLTTNGPLVDPLNVPQNNQETWDTATYKLILTDSSTALRYRDDIQFATQNVYAGSAPTGLRYVPGSCRAFANNGTTSIGASTNTSANTSLNTNFQGPITVSAALSALTTGSDHLPVVADYVIVTPYRTWQAQYFTAAQLANPAVSGDDADPDGDGIPNLVEYALNLDPEQANTQGLPVVGQTNVGGQQYLTLTYTAVIAATDITYVPQVCGDLTSWASGSGYIAPVSTTNNADGKTQTVVVRDLTPITNASARFIRLEITRP